MKIEKLLINNMIVLIMSFFLLVNPVFGQENKSLYDTYVEYSQIAVAMSSSISDGHNPVYRRSAKCNCFRNALEYYQKLVPLLPEAYKIYKNPFLREKLIKEYNKINKEYLSKYNYKYKLDEELLDYEENMIKGYLDLYPRYYLIQKIDEYCTEKTEENEYFKRLQ